MDYVRNYVILFFIMVVIFYACKPKRYEKIRKHSKRKRDYKVQYVSTRKKFHNLLMSKERHLPGISDATDLVIAKKQWGYRVVGAFVYMNADLLKRNKQLIKSGIISRDSKARKEYGAPGIDSVKHLTVNNGGGNLALYHLTHLIAFRHCLSEGDFDGLLFTATAHLNSGARYDLDYVPNYNGTSDSTISRINSLKDYFFENNEQIILDYPSVKTGRHFGKRGSAQYSLNEFEMLLDFFVNWKKTHVFKYGVECHYDKDSKLVDSVNVVIIDVTAGKLLVDVYLANCL